MMNAMTTQQPDTIRLAAEEMVARYGKGALELAAQRAESLAKDGRWPEHALAVRLLTVVEHLVQGIDKCRSGPSSSC